MRSIIFTAALALTLTAPASAQNQITAAPSTQNVYAQYDWLVGNWVAKVGLREVITYGTNRSYLHFAAFVPAPDGSEHLHFEGIAMWNAKTKVLDYLFAVEPGSGVQENGTYRVEPDGLVIREVELIDAKGNAGIFRQTFRRTGTDTAITTVMRKTATGWVPTFPGGERIELVRTPK